MKLAWTAYCTKQGTNIMDPVKHNEKFLKGFIKLVQDGEVESALKIARDPEKEEVIERVRAMQRGSPLAKQLWWSYCTGKGEGSLDPALNNVGFLQGFIHETF